jgi:tellurite resistance protein TerC
MSSSTPRRERGASGPVALRQKHLSDARVARRAVVEVPLVAWGGFFAAVAAILAVDLGYFHRRAHQATLKEASFFAGLWIAVGLSFALVVNWVYSQQGSLISPGEATQLYATGYILEESLSVDNLFVFIVVFHYFNVRPKHQHRVLFYGILGAIVMRGLFIFGGVAALHSFRPTIYILAALLLFTALRMTYGGEEQIDPGQSRIYRFLRRIMPMSQDAHDGAFFHVRNGRRHATVLFLCLLLIEATDVLFALDSVPAVLGITDEAFIVFTSNIFAIVGLRSLYFIVAAGMQGLRYLKSALVLLLSFIGVKMILAGDLTPEWMRVELPITVSLAIVGAILGAAVALSISYNRRHPPVKPPGEPPSAAATAPEEG